MLVLWTCFVKRTKDSSKESTWWSKKEPIEKTQLRKKAPSTKAGGRKALSEKAEETKALGARAEER